MLYIVNPKQSLVKYVGTNNYVTINLWINTTSYPEAVELVQIQVAYTDDDTQSQVVHICSRAREPDE